MEYKKAIRFYFSPNGTTKETVRTVSLPWRLNATDCDLLQKPLKQETVIPADVLSIVGLPVYSGRIPAVCREMLLRVKGEHSPAIVMVVYGNRDYEDALLELKELVEGNGFYVIGAGAFIAQHSIFPRVAANRPDNEDKKAMAAFAQQCEQLLAAFSPENPGVIQMKGNSDYRLPSPVPIKPSVRRKCTKCGACIRICPTHSIPEGNPHVTQKETCISCGACIHVCPVKARNFHGPAYWIAEKGFYKKFSAYRSPEVFYRK